MPKKPIEPSLADKNSARGGVAAVDRALRPEVARLHAVFTGSFSLEAEVVPALRALVPDTQESAAIHVRQGEQRLCLYRVDSPHVVRDHTRAGDLLPLDRGAGGRILSARRAALPFLSQPTRGADPVPCDGLVC